MTNTVPVGFPWKLPQWVKNFAYEKKLVKVVNPHLTIVPYEYQTLGIRFNEDHLNRVRVKYLPQYFFLRKIYEENEWHPCHVRETIIQQADCPVVKEFYEEGQPADCPFLHVTLYTMPNTPGIGLTSNFDELEIFARLVKKGRTADVVSSD